MSDTASSPRRPSRNRSGVTLPELVLVAWLFALVLVALARFASAQGALAARAHDRTRVADLVRTADLVLNGELRYTAAPDLLLARDSLRLRAFRGAGSLCGVDGRELRLRYRGLRRPDPAKDSLVLVTGSDATGAVHAIAGVAADTGCNAGVRVTVDPPPSASAGFALIFESGTYHLSGGALRYRRGRGGRQPVTEAILASGRFEPDSGRLVLRIRLDGDSVPRFRAPLLPSVVRFLNLVGAP